MTKKFRKFNGKKYEKYFMPYHRKADAQNQARYERKVSPNKEGKYARVVKLGRGNYVVYTRKMPLKEQYRILRKKGYRI